MGFAFIILLRILFAACMVFIIGYVFGGFSKRPVLVRITKVAAILAIVLFIGTNVAMMRFAFGHHNGRYSGWRCDEREWRDDRRMHDNRHQPVQEPAPAVTPATPQPAQEAPSPPAQ